MSGDLQIHPLTKTYDEVRRAKIRLQKFIRLNNGQITEASYKLYREIANDLEEIIAKIPQNYHLKPYDIQKEHAKLRGGE